MTNVLQEWESFHRRGILTEIKTAGIPFTRNNIDEIIDETKPERRHEKLPVFDNCPYIKNGTHCHPEITDHYCFLCACPNYDSSRLDGGCKINSEKAKIKFDKSLPLGKILNCEDCSINHSREEVTKYIKENFDQLKKEYNSI